MNPSEFVFEKVPYHREKHILPVYDEQVIKKTYGSIIFLDEPREEVPDPGSYFVVYRPELGFGLNVYAIVEKAYKHTGTKKSKLVKAYSEAAISMLYNSIFDDEAKPFLYLFWDECVIPNEEEIRKKYGISSPL